MTGMSLIRTAGQQRVLDQELYDRRFADGVYAFHEGRPITACSLQLGREMRWWWDGWNRGLRDWLGRRSEEVAAEELAAEIAILDSRCREIKDRISFQATRISCGEGHHEDLAGMGQQLEKAAGKLKMARRRRAQLTDGRTATRRAN